MAPTGRGWSQYNVSGLQGDRTGKSCRIPHAKRQAVKQLGMEPTTVAHARNIGWETPTACCQFLP